MANCSTRLARPQRKLCRQISWNRVVGAHRRAEPIACWIIAAVGVYRIGQVDWALICVDCEHHQCQLELDSAHPIVLEIVNTSRVSSALLIKLSSRDKFCFRILQNHLPIFLVSAELCPDSYNVTKTWHQWIK